tara:strand:+ start:4785 stop:5657 length:873 start_codon:yes stop_codon:yes gene_type:complete
MKYRDIIDKSALIMVGCIRGDIDTYLKDLNERILNNKQFCDNFKVILVHFNKVNGEIKDSDFQRVKTLYRYYFPNCLFISQNVNRGWIFGGADLFKHSYSFICDNTNAKYAWFMTEDFYVKDYFLDLDFGDEEYDYFGLPFFGFGGIKDKTDEEFLTEFEKEPFLPQYNFQIITTDAITYYLMMESEEQDDRYRKWIESGDGSDQRNHTIGAERQLYHTIDTNLLNCKNIMDGYMEQLVKLVRMGKVNDGAHKNIFFKDYGLCHLADINQGVIVGDKEGITIIDSIRSHR